MKYRWTAGARIKADAQKIGERLHSIQKKAGQRITARVVVDEARNPKSPLHPVFEWDDVRAAELFRETQARQVLHSIRVVVAGRDDDEPTITRAFVHVREQVGDDSQSVYVPLARVQAEPELQRQVIEQAVSDLRAFERRYQEFEQLAEVGREAAERIESMLPLEDKVPA